MLYDISTGTGIMKGQIKNFQIHLIKTCFQLQPYITPAPVEIEVHTVPHFKITINTKVEPERLECDGISISY